MEQNNIADQAFMQKKELPNSTAVLVLGILSIVFCWCYGIVGIIMGIIALVLSSKSMKLYRAEPDKWKGFSNLQAGRITAIIGLSISALTIIFIIIMVIIGEGLDVGYDYWEEIFEAWE